MTPPLPPIGFDENEIDSIQIALDPRVLVLPVRFHVFADSAGRVPFTILGMPPDERTFSQLIDPGAVETMRAASTDSGIGSSVQIQMGRFPTLSQAPDPIWTQCDIQFHLDQFELILQQSGLDRQLLRSCDCTAVSNPVNEPVATFTTDGRDGREAIDVFLGGSIQGLLCGPSTRGITCGPSAPCSDTVPTRRVDAVFITGSAIGSDANILSHELGHMIGLGHIGGNTCVDPDDTGGTSGLMTLGAVGTTVTPNQCLRARCIAAQWLVQYGNLTGTEAAAVCAGG